VATNFGLALLKSNLSKNRITYYGIGMGGKQVGSTLKKSNVNPEEHLPCMGRANWEGGDGEREFPARRQVVKRRRVVSFHNRQIEKGRKETGGMLRFYGEIQGT